MNKYERLWFLIYISLVIILIEIKLIILCKILYSLILYGLSNPDAVLQKFLLIFRSNIWLYEIFRFTRFSIHPSIHTKILRDVKTVSFFCEYAMWMIHCLRLLSLWGPLNISHVNFLISGKFTFGANFL